MKPAPVSQDLSIGSLMTQVLDVFIERLHRGEQSQVEAAPEAFGDCIGSASVDIDNW